MHLIYEFVYSEDFVRNFIQTHLNLCEDSFRTLSPSGALQVIMLTFGATAAPVK